MKTNQLPLPPSRQLPAPLYAVSDEWEHNGYDDSDFYRVVFDWNKRELRRFETGSTRYAGRCWAGSEFVLPSQTPETVWAEAERIHRDSIANGLRELDRMTKEEPDVQDIKHGMELELTRNVKHKGATIAKGTRGEIFWSGAYGQFYRNGYNHPNRENTRVGLRLLDGSRVFVALKACRQTAPLLSEDQIQEQAKQTASHRNFYRSFATSRISLV